MDSRLTEIRQRLADVDAPPEMQGWAVSYDIFLEHALDDVRWLVQQLEAV